MKPTGEWELPGGHLTGSEKYKQGAVREVFEETGIKLSKLKTIKSTKNFKMYVSKPRVCSVSLSDEHVDYIWANKSMIKRLQLTKSTTINLKTILDTI